MRGIAAAIRFDTVQRLRTELSKSGFLRFSHLAPPLIRLLLMVFQMVCKFGGIPGTFRKQKFTQRVLIPPFPPIFKRRIEADLIEEVCDRTPANLSAGPAVAFCFDDYASDLQTMVVARRSDRRGAGRKPGRGVAETDARARGP